MLVVFKIYINNGILGNTEPKLSGLARTKKIVA